MISQVDVSKEGEVVLRDRGYFGVKAKGIDFTIKRFLGARQIAI